MKAPSRLIILLAGLVLCTVCGVSVCVVDFRGPAGTGFSAGSVPRRP